MAGEPDNYYSNVLGSVNITLPPGTISPMWASNNGWAYSASSSCSGGPPMDFGYTEPKPVPVERCAYCNIKALPEERLCVGCGAPL